MSRFERIPISVQPPEERINNFDEVCLGYTEEEAIAEAKRCLDCKKPLCVTECPVSINIPEFICEIANGNFANAAKILQNIQHYQLFAEECPQETQCESNVY